MSLFCARKFNPVPDKGWCWVMFIACCVIMFMVFGVHYTYGILYPSLLKEYNKGEGQTAWVGSLSSGLLFLSSLVAVKCCEWTSVTTTCLIGSLLSGGGLVLTSVVTEFTALYFVYGILFGIGSSFLYTPCLIMIGRWFQKYQAITTGIAAACGALGAVVLSPLIEFVIRVNGLRKTIQSCGIIYLTVALICSLCFKPLEKGPSLTKLDNVVLLTEQQKEHNDDDEEKEVKDKIKRKTYFKNKSFIMFVVTMMITNISYYMPIIHLVHYAEHIGITPTSASLLISLWSISNIIGRLLYGKLMSHFRKHLLIVYQISMFCSGIVSIMAYFSQSYWMLCGYVIAYGFLDGSFIGLLSLVSLEITGSKRMAQGYGMMLTCIGIPIAAGPPIIGIINDRGWLPPQFMFALAGSLFVVGAILMDFVRKWRIVELENEKRNEDEEPLKKNTNDDGNDISNSKENISYVSAL